MGSYLFDGVNDKMEHVSVDVPDTVPFSIYVSYKAVANQFDTLVQLRNPAVTNQFSMHRTNTRGIRVNAVVDATSAFAEIPGVSQLAVWESVVGVWAGTADRRAYWNGGNKAVNVTSVGPTGIDTLTLANRPDAFFEGRFGYVLIFDGELTDTDVAELENGILPANNFLAAYDLTRDWGAGPVEDLSGNGLDLTITGATFDSDDSPSTAFDIEGSMEPPPPAGEAGFWPDSFQVQVGWEGISTNIFTFDESEFDSTDTFGVAAPATVFAPADDMSSRAMLISWRRGRDSKLEAMEMGTATITFHDPQQELNPNNPNSPFFGSLEVRRPVRVRATYRGVVYPILFQFVRHIDPQPEEKKTLIHCVDIFFLLNRIRPVIAPIPNITVGDAIHEILDVIEWSIILRKIAPGDALVSWPSIESPADGTKTGLELISELLKTDLGIFFQDASGNAVYKDRSALHGAEIPVFDISEEAKHVKTGPDLERIQNRAQVTRIPGGVPQIAEDLASVSLYGPSDLPAIESPYLTSDAVALDLANHLVDLHANPLPPVWSLSLTSIASENVLKTMLASELGDLIAVSETYAQEIGSYFVEGQEGTLGYNDFEISLILSRRLDTTAFRFGHSRFDGIDVFVY